MLKKVLFTIFVHLVILYPFLSVNHLVIFEETSAQQDHPDSSLRVTLNNLKLDTHQPAYDHNNKKLPTVRDSNLRVEIVSEGISAPTSMAFLGPDDLLVLEKNEGTVRRIVKGQMLEQPVLRVSVDNEDERGMLGIAVAAKNETSSKTFVFLYFTEAQWGEEQEGVSAGEGIKKEDDGVSVSEQPLANRLYRYELVSNNLVNPKLLLDLPAFPGPRHNGGAIIIGPDNNLYIPIGDVDETFLFIPIENDGRISFKHKDSETQAQNVKDGNKPDGRSGILRITQGGKAVDNKSIFGDEEPLNKYFAYGIRNSFGLDFDPVTGKLWDTENGPSFGDEINLVEPGFNSGWRDVQGVWSIHPIKEYNSDGRAGGILQASDDEDLVTFNGKGKYSPPEFTWSNTVGITALKFLDTDKYGKQYENDMFVGDFNNGYLYHFDLDEERTSLSLAGELLKDKIANNTVELEDKIFGKGFGSITDLEVNPYDGYLYVLSSTSTTRTEHEDINDCKNIRYSNYCMQGTLFRIVPES